MDYNPLDVEYNHINQVITGINHELKELMKELDWFENFNLTQMTKKHDESILLKRIKETELYDLGKEVILDNNKIESIKLPIKKRIVILFSKKQRLIWGEYKKLKTTTKFKEKLKQYIADKIIEIEEKTNKIAFEIDKYKKFDRDKHSSQINSLKNQLNSSKINQKYVYRQKLKVDEKLKSVINEIAILESKKHDATRIKSEAESLNAELDRAGNAYERAKIHEQCESAFGVGSPRYVINNQNKIIRQINRDLEKLYIRATQIGKNAARIIDIETIIIDGNNLCYESGEFVGLAPLICLTGELQKKYNVILVFDSAIRAMLRSDDGKITSQFGSKIKVHIVASRQLADETILDIASNNDQYFILSNDRFGEYNDKEIVKSKRLIKHEIVNGKVLIHDLDINISYV